MKQRLVRAACKVVEDGNREDKCAIATALVADVSFAADAEMLQRLIRAGFTSAVHAVAVNDGTKLFTASCLVDAGGCPEPLQMTSFLLQNFSWTSDAIADALSHAAQSCDRAPIVRALCQYWIKYRGAGLVATDRALHANRCALSCVLLWKSFSEELVDAVAACTKDTLASAPLIYRGGQWCALGAAMASGCPRTVQYVLDKHTSDVLTDTSCSSAFTKVPRVKNS